MKTKAKEKLVKSPIDKKQIRKKKPQYEVSLAIAGGGCKALYAMGVGYKLRKWELKLKEEKK